MDSSKELAALVRSHRVFFDKLVESVPAKFYIPDENERPWVFGMSKKEKAKLRKVTKENLKRARRDRLNPEKFKTALQLLAEKKPKEGANKDGANKDGENKDEIKRAATYEELQERLKKRIEMFRAKRHADAAAEMANNARNWQNQKKTDSKKRKLLAQSFTPTQQGVTKRQRPDTKSITPTEKKDEEPAIQMEFGRVKLDSRQTGLDFSKKSKEKKEHLLAKATKLQAAIQNSQEVGKKHSWDSAVNRAAGEKVFDNPKLLKQSLKKEKQQREKSAKKWQERKDFVKKNAEEKQVTRHEHIKERQDARKERKIAKREKKLLRPGFEGRKEGFINS